MDYNRMGRLRLRIYYNIKTFNFNYYFNVRFHKVEFQTEALERYELNRRLKKYVHILNLK